MHYVYKSVGLFCLSALVLLFYDALLPQQANTAHSELPLAIMRVIHSATRPV